MTISYSNNTRIINFHIIWQRNITTFENSRIVPKMRESGILHTKIGARMW